MITRVYVDINLMALQHNLRQVKKFAPHSRVLAMIKANGYGHGLLRVAAALSEADAFGVATLDEALKLRESGIQKPIIVMCGFMDAEELQLMVAKQLTTVIHQTEQLSLLQNTSLLSLLSVWLKLDSGMRRLGFLPQAFAEAYTQLSVHPHIQKPLVFCTHLACSDEPGSPHTLQQIAVFEKTVTLPGLRSIACSAAIIAWPQTHVDWVRPGIMLYGVSPFSERTGMEFDLKPVMTLRARIMVIKQLQPGDTVGYGATWVCTEPTRMGVVSIGYGDGYPRHIKEGTPVLVNGKRCLIIGRVSMDFIAVDLNNQPDAQVGDLVTLWGEGLPVEEIALCAGTTGYELLCKVIRR